MKQTLNFVSFVFGIFLAGLGLVGLFIPSVFLNMAQFFKTSPGLPLVLASLGRILFGLILIGAARRARWSWVLYGLGGIVVVVGCLTLVAGNQMAAIALQASTSTVDDTGLRVWAAIALAFGLAIDYGTWPWRPTFSKKLVRKGEQS